MTRAITITKIYEASINDVFDAWIDPEQLKQWHAPGNMTTPDAAVDLSVGGKYHIEMRNAENQGDIIRGVFKEIEKPTKLVFSWSWEGAPISDTSQVTVLLKELGPEQTELNLTHELLPNEESAAAHEDGWNAVLGKLENFLAK